jgi:hypothetical protein
VPQDHGLEVVVEADAGNAAQVMEGMHMLAQGGGQIHRLDEAQGLSAELLRKLRRRFLRLLAQRD